MAITDNMYQDLIMNPEFMPNRLQNLEMFPPVDVPGRIDFSSGDELVPGMGTPAINFTDAPVENIFLRQNNPTKGFLDRNFNYRALNLGTPEATAKFLAKNNFPIPPNLQGIDTRGFLDKNGRLIAVIITTIKCKTEDAIKLLFTVKITFLYMALKLKQLS